MEQLDQLSQMFAGLPAYRSPEKVTAWLRELLASKPFAAETFRAMKPFNDFLNQALADVQMPARP